MTFSQNTNAVIPIGNALKPNEMPRMMQMTLTYNNTPLFIDLTDTFANGRFSVVQTIFVDNYNNTGNGVGNNSQLIITCGVTNQRIKIPANSQGYYPILLTLDFPSFSISATAGCTFNICLLNVPMPASVWFPNGTGMNFGGNGGPFWSSPWNGNSVSGVNLVGYYSATPSAAPDQTFMQLLTDPYGRLATAEYGVYNSSPPTISAGGSSELQLDVNGRLITTLVAPNNASVLNNNALTGGVGFATVGLYYKLGGPSNIPSSQVVAMQSDSYGSLFVNTETNKPTYAAAGYISIPAGSTDVVILQGSATKTIRIHEILFDCNTSVNVAILLRSTNATGGTANAITPIAHDSNDASATAIVNWYSVAPTSVGTLTGMIDTWWSNNNSNQMIPAKYGERDKSIVLRGTSQFLCISTADFLGAAASASFKIRWTEE